MMRIRRDNQVVRIEKRIEGGCKNAHKKTPDQVQELTAIGAANRAAADW
jgi:hypothetical protein